ncbi:ABC transporter substrate-binding protein [Paenibacillus sp. GCM10012307]|uniref:Extracellular solute-binding protein n=1 Tax=Paenibacillus roseus TaxID=2798579 RepID=A0A934JBZ6_9BACL|nr:extracellular solute-binding protein [Paenibacillus roseus]MBJ6364025.1 extracellular solute-binding protein [Paenibacillus roseus]
MRRMKKALLVLLTATLTIALSACGGNASSQPDASNKPSSSPAGGNSSEGAAPVNIKFFVSPETINTLQDAGVLAKFEQENKNIKLDLVPLSGEVADKGKKLDISLISGDDTDLVQLENSNFQSKYASGGFLMHLDELAKENNYDLEKKFGKHLVKTNGNVDYLLTDISMNVLYFNKKLFDDAKIPYPAGGMSWEQYVDTAKQLTNPKQGIYGVLTQKWDYDFYMLAQQKNISAYKEDGTSNLDDPAFKDAMKFYYDLSKVYKVQPSIVEMDSKQITWDSFMSGKYGMQVIGSWFLNTAADYKSYPRDWTLGIAAPPVSPDGKNVLTAGGAIGINAKSKHPKEAFQALSWLVENIAIMTNVLTPRTDLSQEEYKSLLQGISDSVKGEISADDLYKAFYDNGLGTVSEKISGPGAAQINDLIVKESEKYNNDSQSLDDTMKVIKEQADKIISSAK